MNIPMLDEDEHARVYNDITGFGETKPVAIFHHRVSLYGPSCPDCGKPHCASSRPPRGCRSASRLRPEAFSIAKENSADTAVAHGLRSSSSRLDEVKPQQATPP
jgi:hypothetical protein